MTIDKSIAVWLKAQERQREERESLRESVLNEIEAALTSLSMQYSWDAAYIFGSVTKMDKFRPESDVDVAIRGLDKEKYFMFVSEISSLLNRTVDVINLEDCHFSKSIESEGFKWHPRRESQFS